MPSQSCAPIAAVPIVRIILILIAILIAILMPSSSADHQHHDAASHHPDATSLQPSRWFTDGIMLAH
jgi:hypothetical protein